MFYDTDLATFLADFGQTAAYSHAGGAAVNITVIFDADFKAVNLDTGVIESTGPQAQCKSADVSTAVHGDTLVINSVTCYIRGIEPDGTGITTLILSKQ